MRTDILGLTCEVTYTPPKKYCPICKRKRAASQFMQFGCDLPLCIQCHRNFVFYCIAGRP